MRTLILLAAGTFGWWWGLGSGAGPLVSALLFILLGLLTWHHNRGD